MQLLTLSATIPHPVHDVFRLLADVDRLPEWATSVESVELLDPLPVREGTRFRETRRHNSRSATVDMTVTDLVPDSRLEVSCEQGGGLIVSRWNLEPSPDGAQSTSIRFEMDMAADRWRTRLIVRLIAIFMRGVMRRCIEDDLADLTGYLDKQVDDGRDDQAHTARERRD